MQRILLSTTIALSLFGCPKPSADTKNPTDTKDAMGAFVTSAEECKLVAAPLNTDVDECDYYAKSVLKVDGSCAKGDVVVDDAGTPMGGESQSEQLVNVMDKLQITVYQLEAEDAFYSFLVVRDLKAMKLFYYPLGLAEKSDIGTTGGELIVAPLKVKQLISGGAPEVVVTVTHDFHVGSSGDNSLEGDTVTAESVLWLSGPEPIWIGAAATSKERYVGPLLEDEEGPASVSEKSSATIEWSATGAKISGVSGKGIEAKEGSYNYGALPSACLGQLKM